MQQWRLLDCGAADAYNNMAIDEALLLSQIHGCTQQPTLRFYTWHPAALSLGYAQKAAEVLDETACQEAKVDIVRRDTGGRVVYHNRELTYCIVAQADNPLLGSNIRESYAAISRALIAGLKILGVDACFVGRHQVAKPSSRSKQSGICFLSPSWYEIVVNNRKLIGSAQRRTKGFVLQQGSLLLENSDIFFDYFRLSDSQRVELKTQWRQNTTALWELIDPVSLTVVKQALVQGFEETLSIKLSADEFNPAEKQFAQQLLDKYHLKY